ncbi:MAG: hypothetical protein WBA12_07045, partial [Catalinimonas sp.]
VDSVRRAGGRVFTDAGNPPPASRATFLFGTRADWLDAYRLVPADTFRQVGAPHRWWRLE